MALHSAAPCAGVRARMWCSACVSTTSARCASAIRLVTRCNRRFAIAPPARPRTSSRNIGLTSPTVVKCERKHCGEEMWSWEVPQHGRTCRGLSRRAPKQAGVDASPPRTSARQKETRLSKRKRSKTSGCLPAQWGATRLTHPPTETTTAGTTWASRTPHAQTSLFSDHDFGMTDVSGTPPVPHVILQR